MALTWKVVLVVDAPHGDNLKQGIKALSQVGFEEVHVFCTRRVKVPSSPQLIRHRVEKDSELELWRETIESLANMPSTTDLFFITTPDLEFWEHIRTFAEATIEPEFCGIYLPYTPPVLWRDDTHRPLACRGEFGWCEQLVEGMTEADQCLIMNKRTLSLLSYYLHQRTWDNTSWSAVFSDCVGRIHKLPVFFSKTSLARHIKSEDTLEVKPSNFCPESAEDTNFYL